MRGDLLLWGLALALPFSLTASLLIGPSAVVVPPVRKATATPPIVLPVRALLAEDKAVAGDDDLVEKVRKSIDEGVSFLRSQQRKTDGSWELGALAHATYTGGQTSLALLALLNAGVKPSDDAVQRGLIYLRKIPPRQTYVTGLQTMVYCMVGEKVDHERIRNNVKALLGSRQADGWSYTLNGGNQVPDNSNTQYALLGLHEAIQSGVVKVDAKVLREIRSLFIKTQSATAGGAIAPGRAEPTHDHDRRRRCAT